MTVLREKLIWKKCEYEGCKRTVAGVCDHCGFHPGELRMHDIHTAQRIIAISTVQNEGEGS